VARGLYEMINSGQDKLGRYFTMFCAGAVLISIPITALFAFMQRYYVSGVTGGAVKG
jgi:arabinogalactan oligomer/maltooligosaccharide transport system permease protein